MTTIPEEIIQAIRERVSLLDLVSETVSLKRVGRNHMGLCPFHAEKTPSFSLREEDGFFHCFGCRKKGNAFNFVMDTKGLSFPEAVRFLANRVGIKIPETTRNAENSVVQQKSKLMRELSRMVRDIYAQTLLDEKLGARGRNYLEQRGIARETIQRFLLGYAPTSWEFIRTKVYQHPGMKNSVLSKLRQVELDQLLAQLGLLKQSEHQKRGDYYDTFRERLIFPVTRSDGQPIAFGGRIIEKPEANNDHRAISPKYINSCESPLYAKRKSFFGLSQAFDACRKSRHLFLVEGYLDVLSLSQRGFIDILATCGTAVTADHAQILKRLVDRLTIIFDGDFAGRKAAANCFEVFLNSGLDVRGVFLPEGEDPDSLGQKFSYHQLDTFFKDKQRQIVDLFLEQLIQEFGVDSTTSNSVITGKLASRFAEVIVQVRNPVEQEVLIRHGVEQLGVSSEALTNLVAQRFERQSKKTFDNQFYLPQTPFSSDFDRGKKRRPTQPAGQQGGGDKKTPTTVISKQLLEPNFLGAYSRQLVITVLCDPNFAKAALETLSTLRPFSGKSPLRVILAEELSLEDSTAKTKVEEFLSDVGRFLQAVSKGDIKGVAAFTGSQLKGLDKLPEDKDFVALKKLLEEHHLDGLLLLEEAFQQCIVGGCKPQRMIEEANIAAVRYAFQQEITSLREVELGASDEATLVQVVQQKLNKLRDFDRLQRNSAPS